MVLLRVWACELMVLLRVWALELMVLLRVFFFGPFFRLHVQQEFLY